MSLRTAAIALLAVPGFVGAGAALAGSFTIAPIRVELTDARPTQALTLRNESDEPVLVQARAVRWSQQDGADRFDDTRDVIVTPAVTTLAAKGSQVIRVGLRGRTDATRQLSYRLFLQEVPQSPAAPRTLDVSLRLSLPIFVTSASATLAPRLEWALSRTDDGSLALTAANTGSAHLQLFDLALEGGGRSVPIAGGASTYLLPASRVTWTLPAPDAGAAAGPLRIRGGSDRGDFAAPVALSGP